jgi:SLT domain-containing protein
VIHYVLLVPSNDKAELLFPLLVGKANRGSSMETIVERVMQIYGMIKNLTPEQEATARRDVAQFLANRQETDEQVLAVEGLRFARAISFDGSER